MFLLWMLALVALALLVLGTSMFITAKFLAKMIDTGDTIKLGGKEYRIISSADESPPRT
jgi:uncharacterized protein YoxC